MTGNKGLSVPIAAMLLLFSMESFAQQTAPAPATATATATAKAPAPAKGSATTPSQVNAPSATDPGTVALTFKSNPPPAYPRDELQSGIEGALVLKIAVDRYGTPVVVWVDRSSGNRNLDQVAVDTARDWRLNPRMSNGTASGGIISTPVTYRIGRTTPQPLADNHRFGAMASIDKSRLAQMQHAAEQGDASSEFILGYLSQRGIGLPLEPGIAVQWFEKAATHGDADAQFTLGLSYYDGTFTPVDHLKSRAWFEKAAAQGNALAEFRLGAFYETGDSVPKDLAAATAHYKAAAIQGNSFGQAALGLSYMKGAGIGRDNVLAYAWLTLAAQQGIVRPVGDWLVMLTRTMPHKDIDEAQLLAQTFKPGQPLQRLPPKDKSPPATQASPPKANSR